MKSLLFIVSIFLLTACQNTKQGNSEYQNIEIEKLTPESVVHEKLTEKQLGSIKRIHETFREVYPVSLEQTITNFKRDQHPDNEIEVWLAMADSYKEFSSKNRGDDQLEKRKEGFKLILMRSMMSEEEVLKQIDVKLINNKEIIEIFDTYKLGKIPIKIETH
ncbi:hypothetical protein AWE51_14190 [Aquimarina aggregata]|uniref:Lipoprotein n=1 Tax=Aquimarina aggregata TaxID=1642818 RepID=A0A162XQ52_9FLAO|nr:hypothetical protein [Aquimarina aggregata]KZS38733.1 hypothetical protein AWE51_14190 [Aquimarina aggregata]